MQIITKEREGKKHVKKSTNEQKNEEQKCTKKKQWYYINSIGNYYNCDSNLSTE